MRTLIRQDIDDFAVGAKIMATGGGGELEFVRPLIEEVYSKKKTFSLIDLTELPPTETVAIASTMTLVPGEEAAKVRKLPGIKEKPELQAFRLLGEYIGQELYAVLPTELGAANTLAAMCAAALLDKPTLDADAAGRAKPNLSISTTCVAGMPMTPACVVSHFGDVVYIDKTVSDLAAEDIIRAVGVASGGVAGLCRSPMKGSQVPNAVVHNSISKCIDIGRSIRESKKSGGSPVDSILKVVDGLKFFEGTVSSFEGSVSSVARDRSKGLFAGANRGDWTISGSGKYSGHTLKVLFNNENLISWLDERPFVTCPDSICIVDTKTGLALSNWYGEEFIKGREVTIFGVKAHKLWRTAKGLEIFSPKSFGHDIEYRPLELLVKS